MADEDCRFSYEQIQDALTRTGGLQSRACKYLHKAYGLPFTESAMSEYIKRHPELREIKDRWRTELVDLAEENLKHGLLKRSEKLTMYVLNQLGRDRGYGINRVEHSGPDGGPIAVASREFSREEIDAMTDEQLEDFLHGHMARS